MAINDSRGDNERRKFVADADGNVAQRAVLTMPIVLASGATFKLVDSSGFTIFEIDDEGNITYYGTFSKAV